MWNIVSWRSLIWNSPPGLEIQASSLCQKWDISFFQVPFQTTKFLTVCDYGEQGFLSTNEIRKWGHPKNEVVLTPFSCISEKYKMKCSLLSHVWLFATPWTVAHQAPVFMRFQNGIAIPFSRGPSQPRDRTWVSHIAGRFFTVWTTREAPGRNTVSR